MRLTIEQAEAQGYTVDTSTYPHFGYKGPRFNPTKQVLVLTRDEAMLIDELQAVRRALLKDNPEHPWIPGADARQVLMEIRTTLIAVGVEK